MLWRVWGARVVFAIVCLVSACGRDRGSPTSPTPVVPASPFVGTWTGSIVDSVAGEGSVRLTVTEHLAISLLGSWTSMFGGDGFDDGGTLTGAVEGQRVRVFLTGQPCGAPFGNAARTIVADMTAEGARMRGGYFTLGCGAPREGRLEVDRR